MSYRIEPSWASTISTGGWGGRDPGSWNPGSYLVICDDGRNPIGQEEFVIR